MSLRISEGGQISEVETKVRRDPDSFPLSGAFPGVILASPVKGEAMTGIEQAAKALGLTERQVYRRISGVRPVLADHIRKGENNKLLLDGSAIEILRKVEDHRKEGLTVSQSMERIRDSISGNQPENTGKPVENVPEISGPWQLVIAAKDEMIAAQREEIAHLRAENERLLPLALPSPRRRFITLFRRKSKIAG